MQITDNVYQIKTRMPFSPTPDVSMYVIKGDDKTAIIDTGIGDKTSILAAKKIIGELGGLDLIINTHEHFDHFAGNVKIKEFANANLNANVSVAAHEFAASIIENPMILAPKKGKNTYLNFLSKLEPTKVDIGLKGGEIIDLGSIKLRVIHTPGHAPGHVCLYAEQEKILFSGDQVIGIGTPYVGKEGSKNGGMSDYIKSLKNLLDLDLKLLLPAHGPISKKPHKKIKETMDHKLVREKEILNALKSGEKTIEQLIKETYKLNETIMLKGSILGYLSKLKQENKVVEVEKNKRYRLVKEF